jgi:hypothetical protein
MPQPTPSDVHVDSILTSMSVAYIRNQGVYVATQVFPIIEVDKQSGIYFIYNKNDWMRDEAQRRAPATESAGGGYTLSTDGYNADKYAFHKDVPDEVRFNQDAPIDSDRDATEFVTQKLLLRQERQWAADFFVPSIWGTTITGVAAGPTGGQTLQWSVSTSDPKADITAAKRAMRILTGFEPNVLVVGSDVWDVLEVHPKLISRIQYTNADVSLSPQLVARYLGIDKLVIGKSTVATNVEGETEAYADIYGKSALLAYVPARPGLLTPSAGYIFAWRQISPNLASPVAISRFRMEQIKADRVEGEIAFDDKLVAADLGYFYTSIVA